MLAGRTSISSAAARARPDEGKPGLPSRVHDTGCGRSRVATLRILKGAALSG